MTDPLREQARQLKDRCGYCRGRGLLVQTYDGQHAEADPKDVPCWYCARIEAALRDVQREMREQFKTADLDIASRLQRKLELNADDAALRIEHARKQGSADGYQAGWHSALRRISEGDKVDHLAELVPTYTGDTTSLADVRRETQAEGEKLLSLMHDRMVREGLRADGIERETIQYDAAWMTHKPDCASLNRRDYCRGHGGDGGINGCPTCQNIPVIPDCTCGLTDRLKDLA